MTTESQRQANRRNATHSTGPRSAAGKRRVSRNAITHGLDCTPVLLPEEDAAAFATYRAAMVADHQPVGAEEQDLVERMVAAQWRLRRLWRTESEVHATQRTRRPNADFAGPSLLGDLQEEKAFSHLDRKEALLERTYHRCSARLLTLQDLRRKGLRHAIEEDAVTMEAAPEVQPEAVTTTVSTAQAERILVPTAPEESPASFVPAAPSSDTAIGKSAEQSQLAEAAREPQPLREAA